MPSYPFKPRIPSPGLDARAFGVNRLSHVYMSGSAPTFSDNLIREPSYETGRRPRFAEAAVLRRLRP